MNPRSCSTTTMSVVFEGGVETATGVGSMIVGMLGRGLAFSTGVVSTIGVASSLVSGIGSATSLGGQSSSSGVSEEGAWVLN